MTQRFPPAFRNPRREKKHKASLPQPARSQRKNEYERPDRAAIEMCRVCGAAFYRKRWHASLDDIRAVPKNTRIVYTRCPACSQAAEHVFEGEVIIAGIPERVFDEVLRRIRHIGRIAQRKNPMARILREEPDRKTGTLRLTTSENQLARLIGRGVKEAFGGTMAISLSKEETTVRVRIMLRH